MFLARVVPLTALLLASACYKTNVVLIDNHPRPATHPDSVRLLGQEPAQPYTVVAIVTVSAADRGVESIRRRLLKEAARLGGDAVLLETGSLTTIPTGGGEYSGTAQQLSAKVIVFDRAARSN